MSTFTELNLNHKLLQNLSLAGFNHATPIQAMAIPHVLEGSDLIALAQTGTGKTGAFLVPIIHHLLVRPVLVRKGEPRVLILVPTRELCQQIQEAIKLFSQNVGLKSSALYGGVDQAPQVSGLQEAPEIVVATPGRLLDLLNQKLIRLKKVDTFVLDEADRMLDLGFREDIEAIQDFLPSEKQSLLFSATMNPAIEKLAARTLKNPKKVMASPEGSVPKIIQEKIIFCASSHKLQLLKKIIKEEKTGLFLVFTKTKSSAENIVQYLAHHRTASKTFHGDMKQPERERALQLFKEGSIKVLVATDMASRGIDIEGITHVINFELPLEPETYVHRIGRTGRAGEEGIALSFCDETEKEMLQKIKVLTNASFKTERFEGKKEILPIKLTGTKKVTAPTPGKSQEKTAYLDHSKRQKPLKEGEKRVHPGLKNQKRKRK
jgi:ATP-dependent RNA helicase RhlE